MVLFRDLSKASTDLLQRDFVHEKPWQVVVEHGGVGPTFIQNASVTEAGVLGASSKILHKFPWGSIEGTLGTASASAMATYNMDLLRGLILSGKYEHKHEAPKTLKDVSNISIEYNQEKQFFGNKSGIAFGSPHVKLSVDPIYSKWVASGTAGIGFGSDAFLRFGGEASGSISMKSISYSAGVSLSQVAHGKSWITALAGHPLNGQPFGKLIGSIHCKNISSGSTEIGAEVTHCLGSKQTADVAIVGKWHLKHPTEDKKSAIVKVKLTHDAKVAVSCQQHLSDTLTATIGGQVDSLKFDTVKWGVGLNLLA